MVALSVALAGAVALVLIAEQLFYQWRGRGLPGPRLVVPFIGSVVQMVLNPTKFWHRGHFDLKTKSWDTLLVRFLRATRSRSHVFANVLVCRGDFCCL
jgi:cytochrome P450 family 710 subfamily A protein